MNKKLLVVSIAMTAICLTGCVTPPDVSSPAAESSAAPTSSTETEADITNADLPKGVTTYTAADGTTHNLNRAEIFKASGYPHVNSQPENGKKQKLLVNPIRFQKDQADNRDTIVADDALLTKINKTFTATDEELKQLSGSEIFSVKSFYEKSSFGKGAFDVVVLPCWVDYNGTPTQFRSASKGSGGAFASEYLKNWYNTEYNKTNHGLLGADWQYTWKDFDSDNDGFIDLVWNVYAYPQTENSTEFWWAYVTYTGADPDFNNPNVQTLAFASTNFMTGKFNGYDPHTFIHETGHTYGVLDYYDYNNVWKPMGGVDYMDHNLGDHCAFTKFHYGWVNPWVIKEDMLEGGKVAEITLRTTTTSGDCLVLASPNYNMTAFDEFMMVELMGPHGLAERDYKSGYEGITKGYTVDGLRITHVDNRMWRNNHDEWISDPNDLGRNGGEVRNTNSHAGRGGDRLDMDFWPNADGSAKQYFTQLSLMDSSNIEQNWTNTPNFTADNGTLFKQGQRFNLGPKTAWAKTFMPSGTNLWNKAKTITGWDGLDKQRFTIDENCTFNYYLKVKSIVKDAEYGAVATIEIKLDN